MNSVIAQKLPDLDCTCGLRRTFPIATCGVPPVGMESFCVDCARTWHLVKVDGDSWTWTDFAPPKLGRSSTPRAYESAVRKELGMDADKLLGLAILNVNGRPEGAA
jgi:hypothetical protein